MLSDEDLKKAEHKARAEGIPLYSAIDLVKNKQTTLKQYGMVNL